jgi:hypothetical protein
MTSALINAPPPAIAYRRKYECTRYFNKIIQQLGSFCTEACDRCALKQLLESSQLNDTRREIVFFQRLNKWVRSQLKFISQTLAKPITQTVLIGFDSKLLFPNLGLPCSRFFFTIRDHLNVWCTEACDCFEYDYDPTGNPFADALMREKLFFTRIHEWTTHHLVSRNHALKVLTAKHNATLTKPVSNPWISSVASKPVNVEPPTIPEVSKPINPHLVETRTIDDSSSHFIPIPHTGCLTFEQQRARALRMLETSHRLDNPEPGQPSATEECVARVLASILADPNYSFEKLQAMNAPPRVEQLQAPLIQPREHKQVLQIANRKRMRVDLTDEPESDRFWDNFDNFFKPGGNRRVMLPILMNKNQETICASKMLQAVYKSAARTPEKWILQDVALGGSFVVPLPRSRTEITRDCSPGPNSLLMTKVGLRVYFMLWEPF